MSDWRKAAEQALEALETLMLEKGSVYDHAIQALRQALAQPEQEPVAWMKSSGLISPYKHGSYQIPLYTAPPKREWKGLTPDDKHFLLANAWNKEQAFDGFMEAIDKFLEEKNK